MMWFCFEDRVIPLDCRLCFLVALPGRDLILRGVVVFNFEALLSFLNEDIAHVAVLDFACSNLNHADAVVVADKHKHVPLSGPHFHFSGKVSMNNATDNSELVTEHETWGLFEFEADLCLVGDAADLGRVVLLFLSL